MVTEAAGERLITRSSTVPCGFSNGSAVDRLTCRRVAVAGPHTVGAAFATGDVTWVFISRAYSMVDRAGSVEIAMLNVVIGRRCVLMTIAAEAPLAKVTISTPKRRIDVALPQVVPMVELLPHILRHAGDGMADDGERHGGWTLRRPTGEKLDANQTLAAQDVLDGEVLHLVPGHVEWPELEYDDLVEVIATGARRYGRSWGRAATRRCGLAICCAVLVGGCLIPLRFESPWLLPALGVVAVAAVLMAVGVLIARAVPDARAGAVFGTCSLPYAFMGAYLLTAPDHAGPHELSSPQLSLATVAMLLFGIVGYVGIGAYAGIFAAAIAAGLLGTLGALAAGPLATDGAATLVLATGISLLPAYPLVAARLGRLPLPVLPQRSADLLADEELPPTPEVFNAAARTDEILSGLLLGLSTTSVISAAFVITADGAARSIIVAVVAVALLLRARLFPIPRQRIPLLTAGMMVAAALLGAHVMNAESNGDVALSLLVAGGSAGLAAFAGLVYSGKYPSPYLGRIADITDVVAILALIPLTCYITGFFGYVQGLMASIG